MAVHAPGGLETAWSRAGGRCECRDPSHQHFSGRCTSTLEHRTWAVAVASRALKGKHPPAPVLACHTCARLAGLVVVLAPKKGEAPRGIGEAMPAERARAVLQSRRWT